MTRPERPTRHLTGVDVDVIVQALVLIARDIEKRKAKQRIESTEE